MKVFDDDYCQLVTVEGGPPIARFKCKDNNLPWPPPKKITWEQSVWRRNRYSQLTDEQRESMTHVCRGAEYLPDMEVTGEQA